MSRVLQGHQDAWLTVRITGQDFAIPVMMVQGVLRQFECSPVPLASAEIAGMMNLRGRIVTLIDTAYRLGFGKQEDISKKKGIVIEHDGFLYCLLVDEVGEVIALPKEQFKPLPSNMDASLKRYASQICQMEDALLVLLDMSRMLEYAVD